MGFLTLFISFYLTDNKEKPYTRERICARQHDEPDQPVQKIWELLQYYDEHQEGNLQPKPAALAEGFCSE